MDADAIIYETEASYVSGLPVEGKEGDKVTLTVTDTNLIVAESSGGRDEGQWHFQIALRFILEAREEKQAKEASLSLGNLKFGGSIPDKRLLLKWREGQYETETRFKGLDIRKAATVIEEARYRVLKAQ